MILKVQQVDSSALPRIVKRDELITIVETERQKGRKIVLANGCFDVLHVGHVRYLEAAKALGDLLIVGVNSDEQARRLKGEGRPLLPQDQRAEIISSIEAVDLVTIFSEPTVEQLLLALKPDVPLAVISANHQVEVVTRARQVGAAFLPKPLTQKALDDFVTDAVKRLSADSK